MAARANIADDTNGPGGQARRDLLRAREMEAARKDAMLARRDVDTLRLFVLKQELRPYVEAMPEARGLIDLTLSGSYPPRLWIDLTSFVVMGADNRTWRLMQDSQEERLCLFESDDLEEMAGAARTFIARRVMHRAHMLPAAADKAAAGMRQAPGGGARWWRRDGGKEGRDLAILWLAWLAGVVSGVLGLMAWLVHSGRIS